MSDANRDQIYELAKRIAELGFEQKVVEQVVEQQQQQHDTCEICKYAYQCQDTHETDYIAVDDDVAKEMVQCRAQPPKLSGSLGKFPVLSKNAWCGWHSKADSEKQ